MTREELATATNNELISQLNYCGWDAYYRDYRGDVIAEIKKRMKKSRMKKSLLDKIRAEITDLDNTDYGYEGYHKAVADALEIIDKYRKRE